MKIKVGVFLVFGKHSKTCFFKLREKKRLKAQAAKHSFENLALFQNMQSNSACLMKLSYTLVSFTKWVIVPVTNWKDLFPTPRIRPLGPPPSLPLLLNTDHHHCTNDYPSPSSRSMISSVAGLMILIGKDFTKLTPNKLIRCQTILSQQPCPSWQGRSRIWRAWRVNWKAKQSYQQREALIWSAEEEEGLLTARLRSLV